MALSDTLMDQAETMCMLRDCPAGWAQEVDVQDVKGNVEQLRFCQHHFNELEPTFIALLTEDDVLIDA